MAYKITLSTEWAAVETSLINSTSKLMFRKDVLRMIHNLRPPIAELSKAEVHKRRGLSNNVDELLTKINNDIDLVEGYILVAALIGKAE
jgi:hypothetical protein